MGHRQRQPVFLAVMLTVSLAPALASSAHFDRISLRVAGAQGSPASDVRSESLIGSVGGQWSLNPWSVLELGAAEQWDTFEQTEPDNDADTLSLTARYVWFGGRLVLPTDGGLSFSVALRRHRGVLFLDEDRRTLGYDWGELAAHWTLGRGATSGSATLRHYWWANDDREWRVSGELLTGHRPLAFGLDMETAIDQSYLALGGSLNYRF